MVVSPETLNQSSLQAALNLALVDSRAAVRCCSWPLEKRAYCVLLRTEKGPAQYGTALCSIVSPFFRLTSFAGCSHRLLCECTRVLYRGLRTREPNRRASLDAEIPGMVRLQYQVCMYVAREKVFYILATR